MSFCLLDLELRKSAQFCVFRALALASRDFSVLESVSHVSQAGSLFVAAPKSKIQVDSVEFELILFSTGKKKLIENTSLEVLISLYLATIVTEN